MPGGKGKDDDEDDDFGLEGLSDILKSDEEEVGKETKKRPATRAMTSKKKPSTKKRPEDPSCFFLFGSA